MSDNSNLFASVVHILPLCTFYVKNVEHKKGITSKSKTLGRVCNVLCLMDTR